MKNKMQTWIHQLPTHERIQLGFACLAIVLLGGVAVYQTTIMLTPSSPVTSNGRIDIAQTPVELQQPYPLVAIASSYTPPQTDQEPLQATIQSKKPPQAPPATSRAFVAAPLTTKTVDTVSSPTLTQKPQCLNVLIIKVCGTN